MYPPVIVGLVPCMPASVVLISLFLPISAPEPPGSAILHLRCEQLDPPPPFFDPCIIHLLLKPSWGLSVYSPVIVSPVPYMPASVVLHLHCDQVDPPPPFWPLYSPPLTKTPWGLYAPTCNCWSSALYACICCAASALWTVRSSSSLFWPLYNPPLTKWGLSMYPPVIVGPVPCMPASVVVTLYAVLLLISAPGSCGSAVLHMHCDRLDPPPYLFDPCLAHL